MLGVIIPVIFLLGLVHLLRILPQILSTVNPPIQTGDGRWIVEKTRKSWCIYTSALNTVPGALFSYLPQWARRGYDVGVLAGAIGGLVGVMGSFWALGSVWTAVWEEARLHAAQQVAEVEPSAVHEVVRRAMEAMAEDAGATSTSGGLQPLIPGVTVPLSHLPTLALALILNQLLHELGHAFAAALEDIAPSRISFSIYFLLPSMIISFPSSIDNLPPRAQLRLASSGPWHNLLTWLAISFLSVGGLGSLFWAEISSQGRIVRSVNPLSPLAEHLAPGQLITHLDDIFLGGSQDTWLEYLSGDTIGDAGRGWCVEKTLYDDLSPPPCDQSNQIIFQHTVPSIISGPTERCLTPHPMLDVPSGRCPCPSKKWVCVRPALEEGILRIQLESKLAHREHVILWAGDREAVLRDVIVGTRGPRFFSSLVRWGTLFLEYMSTIALSLYLFNMLPLPGTDGSQFLRALLSVQRKSKIAPSPAPLQKPFQAVLSTSPTKREASANVYHLNDVSDDEDGFDEDGKRARREDKWKGRIRRSVEAIMTALGIGWIAGWAMLALLRSS